MNDQKIRTITLTDHPPVKIREDEWPEIAHGQYLDWDNEHRFQADREWKADIRVRCHDDGRMIVYGVYDYDTNFQGERGFVTRAGQLLDAESDPIKAIREVGEALTSAAVEAGFEDFRPHITAVMRDCVADLPAVEL